ncbi:Cob(I)alamin adenosyltransferase [Gracilaria domingensis]|nr:Cob(I)alamin adenosyltransferase [Gracilaria domingensis]
MGEVPGSKPGRSIAILFFYETPRRTKTVLQWAETIARNHPFSSFRVHSPLFKMQHRATYLRILTTEAHIPFLRLKLSETSLFNGSRVPKDHILVHAYGIVDECNSAIGLAASHLQTFVPSEDHEDLCHPLERKVLIARLQLVQNFLFDLGAYLATPRKKSPTFKVDRTEFPERAAGDLESWIDDMDTKLPKLSTFLLPGGHPASAALHLGRTIARRAERMLTPLYTGQQREIEPTAYRFLNRLSDFLFVASRMANKIVSVQDVKWRENRSALNDVANMNAPLIPE